MDTKRRAEEMASFFDRKIDEYDVVHGRMMPNKAPIADMLPEGVGRILDLGIGTGLELIPIFERHGDITVRGIDVSQKMLERLSEREFADRVEITLGDFFEVDFGSGYDAVISSAALHHFSPADKLILYGKIFDSLRSGGIFINSDRIAKDRGEELALLREYEDDPKARPHMDTPLARETEEDLLSKAGFTSISFTPLEDERYMIVSALKL